VAKVVLKGSRVVAIVGELKAAGMAQHVRMHGKGHLGGFAEARNKMVKAHWGRAASITQADIARAVRAAKQAGATEVEVHVGNERIIIRINPRSDDESVFEQSHKITL